MKNGRDLYLHVVSAFVLAFGMASVKQIGSALVEMQKNVDDLQKNMGTLKAVKDQLAALPAEGGAGILKKALPGMGQ